MGYQGIGVLLGVVVVMAAGFGMVYFSTRLKSAWLSISALVLIMGGLLATTLLIHRTKSDFEFDYAGMDFSNPLGATNASTNGSAALNETPDMQTMTGMMQTMEGMQNLMKSNVKLDPNEMKDMMMTMKGMKGMMENLMKFKGVEDSNEMQMMRETLDMINANSKTNTKPMHKMMDSHEDR